MMYYYLFPPNSGFMWHPVCLLEEQIVQKSLSCFLVTFSLSSFSSFLQFNKSIFFKTFYVAVVVVVGFFIQGSPNTYLCFLENVLNLFVLFESTILSANNFIQMAAQAGHAVAYTIGPILKHIVDCVQHQWLHEYCPIKRQLSLACRRNTYL